MGTIDSRCYGILQDTLRLDSGRIDVRQLALENNTIDDDQGIVRVALIFLETADISIREVLSDVGLLFIAHLTLYYQIVNLQVVEPLRYLYFVSKFKSQSLDVW